MGRYGHELLFADNDLRLVCEHLEGEMLSEIDGFGSDRLLNTNPGDLAEYFVAKYRLDPLVLHLDQLVADVRDQQVDVSQNRNLAITDRSRPFMVPGTVIDVELPFSGDAGLLKCVGSSRSFNPPSAKISGSKLILTLERRDPDSAEVKRESDKWTADIERHVRGLRADLLPWNESLLSKAASQIESRRQKLLRDHDFQASLGIPLKARPDASTTFVPPEVRRKPPLAPPPASTSPFKPEPALSPDQYEHILEVIQKTARMLERSPAAFRDMGEEQLRDQFLVPLNSHYEGQATGETFNRTGKTDILVRVHDRSVFIAECKIWRGPASLTAAIDQLLGYATWRDTKTCLMVFNRNKNLTAVLRQISDILSAHTQFKRELPYDSETGFRFVLSSAEDPSREVTLTVLVFDVPA